MSKLSTWEASVNGRRIDRDSVFPGECHDLFLDYLVALGGSIGDGHASGIGYTDAVWRGFPHYRPGLARLFTKHGPGDIRKGDIVFWYAYAGVGGLPHVAIALADAGPNSVYCMTQNPGPTHREYLTRAGVLGVLRPKTDPTEEPVTQDEINRIAAAVTKKLLSEPVKREGVDKSGKKRTGSISLRYLIANWENQIGISRRIAERIRTVVTKKK